MAMPSVSDIFDEVSKIMNDDNGLPTIINRFLLAGPIATVGYGIANGISSLISVFTHPLDTLGIETANLSGSLLGGLATLLDSGAIGSGAALEGAGLSAWIFAIGLVIVTIWLIGKAYDRLNIDFLSGINIPFIGRFMGASQNEEE